MQNTRVIARLDIKGPNLIKGIHLEGLRVLGDPHDFAKKYYIEGIDELVYIDIVASLYGRSKLTEIVKNAAKAVYVKAADLMNDKFGSKDAEFMKKLISFIRSGAAGSEYKEIELVKLEKDDFKKVRFDKKFDNFITGLDLVATVGSGDPLIEIKDSKSNSPLIQIRFKVEAASKKTKGNKTFVVYPRNYVEAKSNSLLYGIS